MQQPGEHLQRRRLAGTVRSEEADDLAGLDREAHLADGDDIAMRALDETPCRRLEALLTNGDLEDLAQAVDVDRNVSPLHGWRP